MKIFILFDIFLFLTFLEVHILFMIYYFIILIFSSIYFSSMLYAAFNIFPQFISVFAFSTTKYLCYLIKYWWKSIHMLSFIPTHCHFLPHCCCFLAPLGFCKIHLLCHTLLHTNTSAELHTYTHIYTSANA